MLELRTAEWRLQNVSFSACDQILVDFGCPWSGGARSSTKPEKACQNQVKNTRSDFGAEQGSVSECAELMRRIIGGGRKPKKPVNSEEGEQRSQNVKARFGQELDSDIGRRPSRVADRSAHSASPILDSSKLAGGSEAWMHWQCEEGFEILYWRPATPLWVPFR